MALALYRKYRPRTFAEVIGQEHVTEPLSQALRSGRLHHAYLFSGPRGCGKTSSARILARSLNCEQGPTPEPCGVCASCRSLANDGAGSIDVIEIDAASHGGVDDARDLREKAFFAPASSRFKIYVIDEAHMVSSAGFNALLKLVEEPPDYVKFIFATTEPEKVLGTIKSRTHHYPFRLIPPATLRPYLQQLTEAEGVKVEPAVFPLVVRAGGGSARDSLSVLDQLISGAGPEGVTYPRAVSLLGVTDVALIDEMCDALAAGDGATAYATIDRVAEAGHDPRRFASDLLERFRDLIILQQVPDAVTKGLIDGPADQLDAMSAQATRLGPATLSRCADIVHNGLVEMRGTTAPRLLLELITARMLLPGADDSTGALLHRLERMERRLTLSGDTSPDPVRTQHEPAPSPLPPGADPSTSQAPAPAGANGGGGISAARAAAAAAARRAPASASSATAATPANPVPTVAANVEPPAQPTAAADAARPAGVPGAIEPSSADGSTSPQSPVPAASPASSADRVPAASPASSADPVAVASAASSADPDPDGFPPDDRDWDAEPDDESAYGDPDYDTPMALTTPRSPQASTEPSALNGDALPSRTAVDFGHAASSGAGSPGSARDSAAVRPVSPAVPASVTPASGAPDRVAPAAVSDDPGQAAPAVSGGPDGVAPAVSGDRDGVAPGVSGGLDRIAPTAPRARAPEPAGLLPDAPEAPGEAAAVHVPGQLSAAAIREVWPEIITAVGRKSKKIAALASGATVRDLDGQTVVLTFRFPAHAKMVAADPDLIANALYEALGDRWQVRCEVAGEAGGVPNPTAPASQPRAAALPAPTRSAPVATPARQRERSTPAVAAPASAAADDDWPEPAKPGGRSAAPATSPTDTGAARLASGGSANGRQPDGTSSNGGSTDGGSPGAGSSSGRSFDGGSFAGGSPGGESLAGGLPGGESLDGGSPDGKSLGGSLPDGESLDGGSPDGDRASTASTPPQALSPEPDDSVSGAARSGASGSDPSRSGVSGSERSGSGSSGSGGSGAGGSGAGYASGGLEAAVHPAGALPDRDRDRDRDRDGDGGGLTSGDLRARGLGAPGDRAGDPGAGGPQLDPSEHSAPAGDPWAHAIPTNHNAGGLSPTAGVPEPVDSRGTSRDTQGPSAAGSAHAGAVSPTVDTGSPTGVGARAGAPANGAPTTGIAAARAALANARNGAARPDATKTAARPDATKGTGRPEVPGTAGRQEAAKTSGRPESTRSTGRPESTAAGARSDSWSDGSAAAEPPYDPEYDGPPRSKAAGFEGFDPGDEPLDDVIDEKTARQSSEQQAMQLLQDAFGAEKIGES